MNVAFGNNPVKCFLAVSLIAGLAVVPLGCRCLSGKTDLSGKTEAPLFKPADSPAVASPVPAALTNAVPPAAPVLNTAPPADYRVYRPPLPPQETEKITVVQKPVMKENVNVEAFMKPAVQNSETLAQTEVEKLRKEVIALKEKLSETEKELLHKATVHNAVPPSSEEPAVPKSLPEASVAASAPKLPFINKKGVFVSTDAQKRTHIEIPDKSLFLPNTWQLTADGEEILRTVAAELKASQPQATLEIEGHTDSIIGDPKKPTQKHDISSIKSMAAMEFFINSLKWDASRIRTSSHGRNRPVADNGTPEGRARNNRIEIVVTE